MSVIENAKAHYQRLGRRQLAVPEWGDEGRPLVVYWTPITLWEKRTLRRPGQREDDIAIHADVLILKCEDQDGKKLFTVDDRESLMRGVDESVLRRISLEILAAKPVEDLEKN